MTNLPQSDNSMVKCDKKYLFKIPSEKGISSLLNGQPVRRSFYQNNILITVYLIILGIDQPSND